ncbi:MAG: hypothetical protein ACM3JJ_02075 [Hyphomicrobiales bacterium]
MATEWLKEQAKRGMNARTYVLLGILAVTFVWIQSLDARTEALRQKARAASEATAALPAAAARSDEPKQGPSTPTADGWGRDPFDRRFGAGGDDAPAPRHAPRTPPDLSLEGVMRGPAGRTALINGQIVREGDRIGSREVLQIGTRSVVLMEGGTVTTLTLKGDGS